MSDTKAIDKVLQDAVASGQVPGVTAAAANADGVMYDAAFGRRSLASDAAMTHDTVFRIASMTKAITGAAAMQMVEQGQIEARPARRRGPSVSGEPDGARRCRCQRGRRNSVRPRA